MSKGIGCVGYTIAIVLGVLIGIVGLGAVGYFWAESKVISPDPVDYNQPRWTAVDEAALALKLLPAARSLKKGREKEHDISFSEDEANRMFQQYLMTDLDGVTGELAFGDTAVVVRFSKRLESNRYVNGELRADIRGSAGDFEVQAFSVKTGEFEWPRPFMAEVSHWVEGGLETGKFFADDPFELLAIERDGKKLDVRVRTLPGSGEGDASPP